jgi:uncharacterized membrane protein YfcA
MVVRTYRKLRFAGDSPQEGDGFEPSVPPLRSRQNCCTFEPSRWLRLLTATQHAEPAPWWTATLTTFAGLLLGVFVTLSSIGAGALGMTALVLLYPRTPIARLVGSDIAHAVPLTLIAGVGHWLLGSVDWVLLGSLVIGSLPGIFFGSHLSARVPDKTLRPVLATILVSLACACCEPEHR